MITKIQYGSILGKAVSAYVLENSKLSVTVTEYGAAIAGIRVKGKGGETETTLGYPPFDGGDVIPRHLGTMIGRCANRIAGGRFVLGGKEYTLEKNSGNNCLHGGRDAFDNRIFNSSVVGDCVIFRLESVDGDLGFPGNMNIAVKYRLSGNALEIGFEATSDADTLWAPTNHAYFTLGANGRSIRDVKLKIFADKYTPLNADCVPTGEILDVRSTPFDFTQFKKIGADIDSDDPQLKIVGGGYDHNFVLNGEHVATAVNNDTGITLDVFSDMPGVQFYTANYLKPLQRNGTTYGRQCAFCLEPQYFPNAVNTDGFLSPVLRAGETRTNYIRFEFN